MAWNDITYSCGHSGREQLYGSSSSRESYVEWAEQNKMCPECYTRHLAEKRAAENMASAMANKTSGLPDLVGSPKQVAWAETIRAKILKGTDLIKSRAKEGLTKFSPESKEYKASAVAEQVFIDLETETSAPWWIDHRDMTVINEIRKRYDAMSILPNPKRGYQLPLLDHLFLLRAMKKFHIPHLKVEWSESKATFPDLWVNLSARPPVITVTREWASQPLKERHKRLLHEIVGHLIFRWEHNKYLNHLGFTSRPETDVISKEIYDDFNKGIVKKPEYYISEALKNKRN